MSASTILPDKFNGVPLIPGEVISFIRPSLDATNLGCLSGVVELQVRMDNQYSGKALWDPNQKDVPVLRKPLPESYESTTVTSCAAASGGGDPEPKVPKQLRAEAKEFVPRSAQIDLHAASQVSTRNTSIGNVLTDDQIPVHLPQEEHYPQHKVCLQDRLAKFQNPQEDYYPQHKVGLQDRLAKFQNTDGTNHHQEINYTTDNQCNNEDYSNINQVVQRYNEYMQEIIVKPGRFDALARMLLDESISWLSDSQIACAVVDAIVSQAIIERNFQYNGARLCGLLSAELEISDESVFKNHLFERINAEYNKIVPDVEKQPSKAYGFVGFLAELYTQMGHPDLGVYFLNLVDGLISSLTVESMKRVCQLLKLTGKMLDQENKPQMEAVMVNLEKAGYKTKTTHLVGSVVLLREENWGEEIGQDPRDAVIDSSLSGLPCLQSEAVQYGPDGIALSKEESDFLHASSNVPDDNPEVEDADDFGDAYGPYDEGMDEEMERGYLEFLIETKQII